MSEAQYPPDVQAVTERVRSLLLELRVTQWQPVYPNDDSDLWYFSLPDCTDDVQLEGGTAPFLVETCEQGSKDAMKAATVKKRRR